LHHFNCAAFWGPADNDSIRLENEILEGDKTSATGEKKWSQLSLILFFVGYPQINWNSFSQI